MKYRWLLLSLVFFVILQIGIFFVEHYIHTVARPEYGSMWECPILWLFSAVFTFTAWWLWKTEKPSGTEVTRVV